MYGLDECSILIQPKKSQQRLVLDIIDDLRAVLKSMLTSAKYHSLTSDYTWTNCSLYIIATLVPQASITKHCGWSRL